MNVIKLQSEKSVHSNKHIGLTMAPHQLKLSQMIVLSVLVAIEAGVNDSQEDNLETNSNSADSGQNSCAGRGCSDAGWSPGFIFFLGIFGCMLFCALVAGCLRVAERCYAISQPGTHADASNNEDQIEMTLQGQSSSA